MHDCMPYPVMDRTIVEDVNIIRAIKERVTKQFYYFVIVNNIHVLLLMMPIHPHCIYTQYYLN